MIMSKTKKRAPLTDEQKAAYLACGGTVCPYCGCGDVEADSAECDGTVGWANVLCRNPACKAEWTDQWTLTGIAEIE